MNERIKELALEARIAYYSKNGSYERSDEGLSVIPSTQRLEEFAELIVGECAGVNYKSPFRDGEFHAREVLEHFGIK